MAAFYQDIWLKIFLLQSYLKKYPILSCPLEMLDKVAEHYHNTGIIKEVDIQLILGLADNDVLHEDAKETARKIVNLYRERNGNLTSQAMDSMLKKLKIMGSLFLICFATAEANCPNPILSQIPSEWKVMQGTWQGDKQFVSAYWEKFFLAGQPKYKLHCLYTSASSGSVILKTSPTNVTPPSGGSWQCSAPEYCTCTDTNIANCPF